MDTSSFRASIPFAERMMNVTKIKDAYLAEVPHLTSVEAQAKARLYESTALQNSSSQDVQDLTAEFIKQEEYVHSCLEEVQGLQKVISANVHHPEVEDSNRSGSTEQIGQYKATYHQSGLFSTVYKARDPQISGLIALKLTVPSQCTAPHDPIREARILAAAAHRNILPLIRTFPLAGGKHTLVFPFLPLDLDSLLHNHTHPPLTPKQSKSHLHDLFSGLAHIHPLGIIHRDIKPSNILLASPDGPACIADFGIAWMAGDAASEPASRKITDVGTTAYRPPELLFGHRAYGCALDLWAAGCVVAEVAAGRPHPSLFDSGPLGSDLALIQSVFKTLGTPTDESWPEAPTFSDWGKMAFHEYPAKPWGQILPRAEEEARDLVGRLVTYQSSDRMSAAEALDHPFFKD